MAGPMTMQGSQEDPQLQRQEYTIECCVCAEDRDFCKMSTIDDTQVCNMCIQQMFTNAVEDESNYPPRWAAHELELDSYRGILSKTLISQYERKVKEYQVPWDDRVYCSTASDLFSCRAYLGRRSNYVTEKRPWKKCKKCAQNTCMLCKDFRGPKHKCDPAKIPQEEDESFAALKKGKDWQKCPNPKCQQRIELLDGCNHVTCTCGASFCFICGQPAEGNSHHWSKNGGTTCPRYNHPSAPNAIWDEAHPFVPAIINEHVRAADELIASLQRNEGIAQRQHERLQAEMDSIEAEVFAFLEGFAPTPPPVATAARRAARERRLTPPRERGPRTRAVHGQRVLRQQHHGHGHPRGPSLDLGFAFPQ